jgi:hypothetical protein
LARIYEEDVIEEDSKTGEDKQGIQLIESLEILDDYTKAMEHRSKAYSIRGSN